MTFQNQTSSAISQVLNLLNDLEVIYGHDSTYEGNDLISIIHRSVKRIEFLKTLSDVTGLDDFLQEFPDLCAITRFEILYPKKMTFIKGIRGFLYLQFIDSSATKLSELKDQYIIACTKFLRLHGINTSINIKVDL